VEFLSAYGLFLAKTLTLLLALVFLIMVIAANASRQRHGGKDRGHLEVIKLNDELDHLKEDLRHAVLDEEVLKQQEKKEKKQKKQAKKEAAKNPAVAEEKQRIYVLDFDGDIRAHQVEELRNCITAILTQARPGIDEVMLRLESPGGLVHAYGLAASQLVRFRRKEVKLTIAVDKVAASGGYMMACIANHLLAAPFAMIGSIGVIVELPNLHRLLKEHNVDYEQISAGEYKRTLSNFGEITEKGRQKVQEDVDEMHRLFKEFITTYRPALEIDKVATGEVWTGNMALGKGLVDEISTSDEWLLERSATADIYLLSWEHKKQFKEKLSSLLESSVGKVLDKVLLGWFKRADKERYYS
jgi:serine protease SohB